MGLKKKRDEGRIRHIEENAIKKLLEVIDLTTFAGLREYVTILLTLDTGIRPKEAFSLRISDIVLLIPSYCQKGNSEDKNHRDTSTISANY